MVLHSDPWSRSALGDGQGGEAERSEGAQSCKDCLWSSAFPRWGTYQGNQARDRIRGACSCGTPGKVMAATAGGLSEPPLF
eukprot:2353730-Alexandrium_andersonii.AAC.1